MTGEEIITERPDRKISYLFRDGILGKDKETVCQSLGIEESEVVFENIAGKNSETTYKWNNGVLEAIYTTVEVIEGIDYDYAREHQALVDEVIDSCEFEPNESNITWADGVERTFSNTTWNDALSKGELVLYDKFDLEDGSIIVITSNNLYDDLLDRSRNEKVFQTIIVSNKEYVNNFIDALPDITKLSLEEQEIVDENGEVESETDTEQITESGVSGLVS